MKKDTQKVAMTSENIENENLQKLRAVFPQFVKCNFRFFERCMQYSAMSFAERFYNATFLFIDFHFTISVPGGDWQ